MSTHPLPPELLRLFPGSEHALLERLLAAPNSQQIGIVDLTGQVADHLLESVDSWGLACDIASRVLTYASDFPLKINGLKRQLQAVRKYTQGRLTSASFLGEVDRLSKVYSTDATPAHSCDFTSRAEYVIQRATSLAQGEPLDFLEGSPLHVARIWQEAVDRAGNLSDFMGLERDAACSNERQWYIDQLRWRVVQTAWRRLAGTARSDDDAVATYAALSFMIDHQITPMERSESGQFRLVVGDVVRAPTGELRTIIGYGVTHIGEHVYVVWRHESRLIAQKRTSKAAAQYTEPFAIDAAAVQMLSVALSDG